MLGLCNFLCCVGCVFYVFYVFVALDAKVHNSHRHWNLKRITGNNKIAPCWVPVGFF